MDAIAAAQERLMQERLKHKIDQINSAAQTQLEPVHHHINFTLQVIYPPSSFHILSDLLRVFG